MRRHAFTLAEMLIAVTIGVAVMAAALMIFNLSNRSRNVTATARALQTALLIQERFQDDLGRLIPGSSPIKFHPEKPNRVSFYAYDPTPAGKGTIAVRGVVYALDEASGLLQREWMATKEAVGVAPLKSAAFLPFLCPTGLVIRVNLVVGREKGEPPGPDTVHSFLARLPSPRLHPSLKFKLESGFLDKAKDEPKGVKIPVVAAAER